MNNVVTNIAGWTNQGGTNIVHPNPIDQPKPPVMCKDLTNAISYIGLKARKACSQQMKNLAQKKNKNITEILQHKLIPS